MTFSKTFVPLAAAVFIGLAAAAPATAQLAAVTPAAHAVTLVKVPRPWYALRPFVVSKMRDALPEYRSAPGLHYKYFTLADSGEFGGIYLWQDAAAARAWFTPAWFERVRRERGVAGEVRTFDAPVVLDNEPMTNTTGVEGMYSATLVLLPAPKGATRDQLVAAFNAAAPRYRNVPGLMRKIFVIAEDGRVGGIYLWADRMDGLNFFDGAWKQEARRTHGAAAQLEWFDAPLLVAASRVDNRTASAATPAATATQP